MKIKPANLDPAALPQSRGAAYSRDTRWGIIAQKWPRKRGPAKTPADRFTQQEFALAARWASNPEPKAYETAFEMVKGTSFVPRDFLISAMYGNAYEILDETGFIWEVERKVSTNPQYILDHITNERGSMLFRGVNGWRAVPKGNPGEVLTLQGEVPRWEPGGGGGGGECRLVYDDVIPAPTLFADYDVAGLSEIMFLARQVTAAANTWRTLWVSTDNGSTYWTANGNYVRINAPGDEIVVSGIAQTGGAGSGAARSLTAHILGNNLPTPVKTCFNSVGSPRMFVATPAPITNLRLDSGGANLTGGRVTIIGR